MLYEVITSLDLDGEQMKRLGFTAETQLQMQALVKTRENIEFLKGDSKEYDFESLDIKCDLIFIDGNHTFEYVRNNFV